MALPNRGASPVRLGSLLETADITLHLHTAVFETSIPNVLAVYYLPTFTAADL